MKYLTAGAAISDCGKFRHKLWRAWDEDKPRHTWVCLNPSTADGNQDDPSLRKMVEFTNRWGGGGITVVNLYDLRATKPADLWKASPRFSLGYGTTILLECMEALALGGIAVAGWGTNGVRDKRGEWVADMLVQAGVALHAIKILDGGVPQHPLMAAYTEAPVLYRQAVKQPPPAAGAS